VHKGFLTYCGVIPICYAVPPVPSDQEVKKAADKLASFGVKNGHQFENFMHQKNRATLLSSMLSGREMVCSMYFLLQIDDIFRSGLQMKLDIFLFMQDHCKAELLVVVVPGFCLILRVQNTSIMSTI
jgi:hypothetical protein